MEEKPYVDENNICKEPSWISFLPEIYWEGEDSFLCRYLKVFQRLYEKMSQKIENMPHMLYPEHGDRRILEWLAEWFAIENIEIWDDRQLAYLLLNQNRLSGMRGTKAYMKELVRLFTGYTPYIIEYYQTLPYQTDIGKTGMLERLYGNNAYVVTMLLPKRAVQGQQKAAVLRRIIKAAAPAQIECRLVILQSCIYLGQYSYLGLNSYLAGYSDVRLDDRGLLPYRSVLARDA